MKSLKKIVPHLLAFIIFGLIYFIPLEYFWGNWSGYIFYIVMFTLVELIYYHVRKKTKILTKTKNKIIFISSVVIGLLVIFSFIFCTTDYIVAKNGKEPIFSKGKISWAYKNNHKEAIIDSADATVYFGFGYKISVCNICEKSVDILPLGIGNYPIEYLSCSYLDENIEATYTFVGGKLDNLDQIQTFTTRDVENIKDSYEEEAVNLSNTPGCYGEFKEYGTNYQMWKNCTISEMLNADIDKIYGAEKEKITLSRNKLIKLYKDQNIVCELK